MKEGQRALLEKSITSLVTKSSLLRFCLKLYYKKRKLSVVNGSTRGFPSFFLSPLLFPLVMLHAFCSPSMIQTEMTGDKLGDYCTIPRMIKFNFLLFIIHIQLERLIQELMK